jgi:hypothetical protein
MTLMLIPCSRNAHDQNVLVRRPQWDQHECHTTREREANSEKMKETERPTVLLAHRTPTMKLWSSDARSKGQFGGSP